MLKLTLFNQQQYDITQKFEHVLPFHIIKYSCVKEYQGKLFILLESPYDILFIIIYFSFLFRVTLLVYFVTYGIFKV